MTKKTKTITARMDADVVEAIRQAAKLCGVTIHEFMRISACTEANRIFREYEAAITKESEE